MGRDEGGEIGVGKGANLHDRPVLCPWVLCEAKDGPDYDILLQDIIVSGSRICDAFSLDCRLQRISSTSVELIVPVLCHPHVALRKEGSLRLRSLWVGQQELGDGRQDLISHGMSAHGIDLVEILHLENPVRHGVGEEAAGCGDGRVDDLVVVAVRVRSCVNPRR